MSDEKVVSEVVNETKPVETKEVEATPQVQAELTPVEQQASEQGWVPKSEWEASGRDVNDWRPAKEFVERGELYKSIHTTRRELKQATSALDALQKHHKYVFEKAHEQALRDLRAEKRLAIRNQDMEHLEEVESKIEETQDQYKQEAAQLRAATQPAQVQPELEAFISRNPWYVQDKTLRDEADAVGFIYLNNGGDRQGLLAHVEKEMRRKFPEKFGVKRAAPNAVQGVNKTTKAAPKDDFQLTSEERQVMMTFVNAGVMSEADYIKELKKLGR